MYRLRGHLTDCPIFRISFFFILADIFENANLESVIHKPENIDQNLDKNE